MPGSDVAVQADNATPLPYSAEAACAVGAMDLLDCHQTCGRLDRSHGPQAEWQGQASAIADDERKGNSNCRG